MRTMLLVYKADFNAGLFTTLSKMMIWQGLDGSAGLFVLRVIRLMNPRWFSQGVERLQHLPHTFNTQRSQNIHRPVADYNK